MKQLSIHRDETETNAWQDICDYLKVDPKKTVCLNFEFKNFKSYTKKQYKKETGDIYVSFKNNMQLGK